MKIRNAALTLGSATGFIGSLVSWIMMMRYFAEAQWMNAVACLALFVVTYTVGMVLAEA